VWRLQRSIDGDVDALSASKQEDLGRFLARTGGDGRRTYADLRAVDSDAADTLAAIDDPVTQRQFVNAYQRGEVDSDELATALRRYDSLDSDSKSDFDEFVARNGDEAGDFAGRADSDTFDSVFCSGGSTPSLAGVSSTQTDRYYSSGAPSVALSQGGEDCVPDELGLSESQANKYEDALDDAEGVEYGPITDRDELDELLLDLADRDGFDDLDNVVGGIQGNKKGFKGLSGEGYIGKGLDNRDGIKAADGDVEFEKDVTKKDIEEEYSEDIAEEVEESNKFKNPGESASDIDINANTELKINGRTLNNPAIESKNLSPESTEYIRRRNLNELKQKLRTHTVAGEDEIVVVMNQDYIDSEANRIGGSGPSREVLSDELESDIETELSDELGVERDVTVEVTSYKDI